MSRDTGEDLHSEIQDWVEPRRLALSIANLYTDPVQEEAIMASRTTYTQARAHLASLCDEVAETREPYIIERRNGENVALISEQELESLLETAHLLRSPRNARRLLSALERALGSASKDSATLGELRREFGLEAGDHAEEGKG